MHLLSKPYGALATAWNSNEFFRARIKLTGLYLIVLTCVLGIVTVLLLAGTSYNLRQYNAPENIQISKEQVEAIAAQFYPGIAIDHITLEDEDAVLRYSVSFVDDREMKIDPFTGRAWLEKENFETFAELFFADFLDMVLMIDLVLVLLSGILSYILAGKTLEPIALKMQQQKQFVGDAAHELRNPLAAIRSSAESALREKNDDAQLYQDVLQDVIVETDGLIATTEQLLELARFDEQRVEKKLVKLHELIPEVISTLSAFASEKNVSIRQDVPPFELHGDSNGLRQLLFNLLHNAIKFSNAGEAVTVTLTSEGVLQVHNNGIHIEQKHIPHLFDRFFTGDASHATGTGLGLSVVQSVALAHGATIHVKSEEKNGTTFTVIF